MRDEAMRERVAAYGTRVNYIDLQKKNRRNSAILIVFMILLAGVLGAAIGGLIGANNSGDGGGRGAGATLAVSAVVGFVAALAVGGLGATWSYFSGANAILSMSGARQIEKRDDPELFNVVEEVAIAAGLPMPRVYLIQETALNAFATGRDPAHAAVAITTGLRERLTRDELQGVMAHEMAHVRHLDIRFALLMATMVGLIVFACDALLRSMRWGTFSGGGRRSGGKDGGGAAVAIMLVVVVLLSILAPILARMIQMAYSRQREYLADAGAVELTRNPLGLASALQKLAEDREPLIERANRGTAHLFIVNPLEKVRKRARGHAGSVWSSHPPVEERIARLVAMSR
jgi:heat shock protein HtpX